MRKVRIGDLFELEKGSLQSSKCIAGQYDFITASKEWKTHNEFSHNTEALIFAAMASGSLGRIHYVNGKFITSDLCYILTPKDSKQYPINLKFYHFVFNSLRDEIIKNTKSGTSKESINQTNLKKYEIPYFDIEQQNIWIGRLLKTKSIKEDLRLELETQQTLLKKLRQSILQEAIKGKLTASWREQNPDVESASVLLEKIKSEKEQLILEKKIKKPKPLPPINEDEIPFEIPNSWEWCRLDDISNNIHYGFNASAKPEKTDVKLLRITDIQNNTVNWNSVPGCDYTEKDLQFYWKQLYGAAWGAGQPNVNGTSLSKLILPLPPLEEQKEIVQKTENLFAICDELETQIETSKKSSQTLMQAVLKEAFEG